MDPDTQDGVQRWKVGAVAITSIPEFAHVPRDGDWLFPDIATVDLTRHRPLLAPAYVDSDDRLIIAVQTFVIDTGTKRIIVDTCVGNDKERSVPDFNRLQTDFIDRLVRAGYPLETIDVVLCTHMHADHCGWNTRLEAGEWIPTFPNASYLFGRTEFEHWQSERQHEGEDDVFADSIQPIVDAGLAELVETTHIVSEEVSLIPTPGHTPGHVSVRISSQGSEAFITGDMIHHPLQFAEPNLCTGFCYDKEQTRATRKQFIEHVGDSDRLVLGSHFPRPTGGRVVVSASEPFFVPQFSLISE